MNQPRAILPLLLLLPALAMGEPDAVPAAQEDWPALLESAARPAMQGKLDEAENQLRHLLARAPDQQPALQADILHRLQFVLLSRQQHAAASEAAARALALRQQVYGSTHLKVAESQQAYARLLALSGQVQAAEKLLRQALQTRQTLAGHRSLPVAETQQALGVLYQQRQQHDKAAAELEQALAIRQQGLPADHPDILHSQARLGASLQQLQQHDRAISLLQAALEGETRRGNADGLHAAIIQRELAYCHHYQHRFAEAEAHYQQALSLLALNLGSQHHAYATTLQALGWLYISSERETAGRALLEQAQQLLQEAALQPPQRQ